ncbi:tetraspanin-5 isoform X2 [Planococcus citri]|uniref:tetraspanin-5 isoform X2 n=1 Tax=Planococcus citri TaxID=170843 RepID=UPI0031F9503D
MPVLHYRQGRNDVNCFLKYLLFIANFMLWSFAILILTIGIWSWSEKDRFSNFGKLAHVVLDPAFVFFILGTVAFVIGFTGCVGALRENTVLLYSYAIFLAVLLLFEITCGVLLAVFKDWIKAEAAQGFQTFIIRYREDPDQQNFIDWVQEEWLQCCGIDGPKDWDKNNYFNCSSQDIGSREACGVPFSCCKKKPNEVVKNKQCGYDVRKTNYYADKWTTLLLTQDEGDSPIYENGCIKALEEWLEKNYFTINLIIFFTIAVQVLGISFAQNLRSDIIAQKAAWY